MIVSPNMCDGIRAYIPTQASFKIHSEALKSAIAASYPDVAEDFADAIEGATPRQTELELSVVKGASQLYPPASESIILPYKSNAGAIIISFSKARPSDAVAAMLSKFPRDAGHVCVTTLIPFGFEDPETIRKFGCVLTVIAEMASSPLIFILDKFATTDFKASNGATSRGKFPSWWAAHLAALSNMMHFNKTRIDYAWSCPDRLSPRYFYINDQPDSLDDYWYNKRADPDQRYSNRMYFDWRMRDKSLHPAGHSDEPLLEHRLLPPTDCIHHKTMIASPKPPGFPHRLMIGYDSSIRYRLVSDEWLRALGPLNPDEMVSYPHLIVFSDGTTLYYHSIFMHRRRACSNAADYPKLPLGVGDVFNPHALTRVGVALDAQVTADGGWFLDRKTGLEFYPMSMWDALQPLLSRTMSTVPVTSCSGR